VKRVKIYTDGACSGNPGPGGWGALLRYGNTEKTLSGGESETTNNRMEMLAAIKALEALRSPCRVTLYTDSKYLLLGITEWMDNWKKNGWRTANRKAVKNIDFWQRLDELLVIHKVKFKWVKGHSGHDENELVDDLARAAIPGVEVSE